VNFGAKSAPIVSALIGFSRLCLTHRHLRIQLSLLPQTDEVVQSKLSRHWQYVCTTHSNAWCNAK